MSRRNKLTLWSPEEEARQDRARQAAAGRAKALELIQAQPRPDAGTPPAPTWLTPEDEFAERPDGLAVALCSASCPWLQSERRHNADLVLAGKHPEFLGGAPPWCALLEKHAETHCWPAMSGALGRMEVLRQGQQLLAALKAFDPSVDEEVLVSEATRSVELAVDELERLDELEP